MLPQNLLMSGMGNWPADLIIPAILTALWIMTVEYTPLRSVPLELLLFYMTEANTVEEGT